MKLARRVASLTPSPTLAITAQAKAMREAGLDVIGFGAGEPDFDTPQHIKDAAVRALAEGFTKYCPAAGIPELLDAVCETIERDHGIRYRREQVVITSGAKHALYLLAQVLFEEDDEVLIVAPYWVSYAEMVELAGATPVFVPTEEARGFRLRAEDLAAAVTPRTRGLVLNTPCNPTGACLDRADLEEIAVVCRRHDLVVISDEVYEKLVYDGVRPVSIVALDARLREHTILVSAVSKTYAMTGWRVGYALGPADVIARVAALQSQSTSSPTSFAMKAAVAALRGPQETVTAMCAEFARRRDAMHAGLVAIPGITCVRPAGAFYAFPNVGRLYGATAGEHKITDSVSLTRYLLDAAQIAVVPGAAFGSDAHIRLSFATSMENIAEGLARMARAVAALR